MQSTENISLLVALGGGLFSFLSPCVLPLLPSYLSFITGMSVEDLQHPPAGSRLRGKVFLNALLFVLGFSTVFILLGFSFSVAGRFFAVHQALIQKVAGVVVVLVGLYILGLLKIPSFTRTKEVIHLKNRPGGYFGSVLVGVAFGTTWTPCIGPILGAILALAGASQGINQGTSLLMTYSAGLAIPFLATSLAVGYFLQLFRQNRKIFQILYVSGGVFLIAVGLLIMTGYYAFLNTFFTQFIPHWLVVNI